MLDFQKNSKNQGNHPEKETRRNIKNQIKIQGNLEVVTQAEGDQEKPFHQLPEKFEQPENFSQVRFANFTYIFAKLIRFCRIFLIFPIIKI